MEIKFTSPLQVALADLMWAADSRQEVDKIVEKFGHDAWVVREMILASVFDQVEDLDQAKDLLAQFQRPES